MVVLSNQVYHDIVKFLSTHKGLSIEVEENVCRLFPDVPRSTIRSIISKQGQNALRTLFHKYSRRGHEVLVAYEKRATNDRALMEMAIDMNYPPIGVARLLLNEKYSKVDVKRFLFHNPEMIPNPLLSANVFTCIFNDIQDGVVIDMVRYSIGEEHEIKLKKLAREAGLTFFDECDLRRIGFDKTPDLLLAVQCMYKDNIINWIESKASFGDRDSHAKYVKEQLSCYSNRFGPGIVIYWFGYQEDILNINQGNLIILDDFPTNDTLTTFDKLYVT